MGDPSRSTSTSSGNIAVWGFVWGMLVGGIIAFFRAPRLNVVNLQTAQPLEQLKQVQQQVQQEIREKLGSMVQNDPINDSIAEGKAAARRRLAELGLSKSNPDR